MGRVVFDDLVGGDLVAGFGEETLDEVSREVSFLVSGVGEGDDGAAGADLFGGGRVLVVGHGGMVHGCQGRAYGIIYPA